MITDTYGEDEHKKRVFEAQMKLASYDWPDQELWVKEWTRKVLAAAAQNPTLRTGQHLYLMLPDRFQVELASTLHDPFHGNLRKSELITWFIRHITFNEEGKMVILRDYERALEIAEEFE